MLLLSMPLEKFAQALRKRHPTHFWSGPLWALFEQLITGSLSNHHTIMNTTKATPDHHKCEFAAFRLSKFFSPSATGVWAPHQKGVGRRSPRAFGARRLSGRVLLARPTPFWSGAKGTRRKAKPCTTSPAGESISLFAENYPNIFWRTIRKQ